MNLPNVQFLSFDGTANAHGLSSSEFNGISNSSYSPELRSEPIELSSYTQAIHFLSLKACLASAFPVKATIFAPYLSSTIWL